MEKIPLAHWVETRKWVINMLVTKKRKVRSDKKVNIKPTILLDARTAIYRLSDITDTPVKDIGEYLCKEALTNKGIIDELAKHLKRDVAIDNTLYRGNPKNPSIIRRAESGDCDRITIRVTVDMNNILENLAYCLSCAKARVTAALIEYAITDFSIVDDYVKGFLEEGIDKHKMKELKKLFNYVNDNESGNEYSWASMLSVIVDEVRPNTATLLNGPNEIIEEYLINNWRDN